MPFVDSDPGPPTTFPPRDAGPTAPEAFGAAFRQGNSVVSTLSAIANSGHFEPVDGYNAKDEIKDKPEYWEHADRFAGSRSPAETQLLMGNIDRENADKRTLAASGGMGLVASAVAGSLDPTMLLPGRVAIGLAKDGTAIVRGAIEVGGAMAVQSAAQEVALQATQETRTPGETVLNIGSATLLGAFLGGAIGTLSKAEHADLVDALDRGRAKLDFYAGNFGELPEKPTAPMRVYHRTVADKFESFDPKERSYHSFGGDAGIYFSTDPHDPTTSVFGANIVSADVTIKNPAPVLIFKSTIGDYPRIAVPVKEIPIDHRNGNMIGGYRIASSEDHNQWESVGFGQEGIQDFVKRANAAGEKGKLRHLIDYERISKSDAVDLRQAGYDGIVWNGKLNGKPPQVVAFDSSQTKVVGFGREAVPPETTTNGMDTHAMQRQVISRDVRGRPIDTIKFETGADERILEAGLREAQETARIAGTKEEQEALARANWESHGADLDSDDLPASVWNREAKAWDKAHPWQAKVDIEPYRMGSNPEFEKHFDDKYLAGKKRSFPGVKKANEWFEEQNEPHHAVFLPGENAAVPMPGAAGAAATDTREIKPVSAFGLEKFGMDAKTRGINQPFVTARRATAELGELPLELEQNLKGKTTTLAGGPSVETQTRVTKFTTDVAILAEMKDQWKDLRFDGQKAPWFAQFRDQMGWLGRPAGLPSFEEFDRMVGEAMSKNDTHDIPQVQSAAQFIRSKIREWPDRAEQALEGFQKTEPKEGEGYFPHDWKTELIRQQRPEFVNFLTGIFDGTQRTKQEIQNRVKVLSDQLVSHETSIKKLTAQVEKLKQSGKSFAGDELEAKLNGAHANAAAVRKKIEAEIGKWEGRSTAEAKSALKAREKYEAERAAKAAEKGGEKPTSRLASADDAVDLAVKRILASDQNLDVEALRAKAHETADHILSTPDGRIYNEGGAVQFGPRPASDSLRGSEARRTINVSNAEAWPWINQDAQRVWRKYMNTMVPDVLLAERFGDVEMSNEIQKILDEHAAMSDATKNPAERTKLDKQKDGAIEDIAHMRDELRGVLNLPVTETSRRIRRFSAAARNFNVLTSMGMSGVNSIGDAAGVQMRFGMLNAFRDAFIPYFKSLATDRKFSSEILRQFKAAGIAVDTELAARHHELSGVMDSYQPGSPLERFLKVGADRTQLVNMLGPWTDAIKSITATVAAVEMKKGMEALMKGTASEKQLRILGAGNINGHLAEKILAQYEKHGNIVDGIMLPNLSEWTNREAKEAFNGALSREANIGVVTPGIGDKPNWMSDPVLGMLGQFKSYTAAAHTRILIANLQRRDGDALGGLVAAMGMGMLSYKIGSLTGGQPVSDKPADWVKEGMSRANILGWFEESNAFASKMTRGQLDAYRLTGSSHMLSKYAGRSALDQILGPTAGKIERLSTVTGSAASMDWKGSDTHALRQLIFWQNMIWFRGVLNEVEQGANGAFGVPQRAAH